MSRRTLLHRAGAAALALVSLATAAGAQAAPVPRSLDVRTALDVTAERDASWQVAREEAAVQAGIVREARGAFDLGLVSTLSWERSRGALLPSQIEAEEQRRDLFRTILREFTEISDDLERQLEEGGRPVANCTSANIIINGVDICLSDAERLAGETFDEMLRRLIAEADPTTRQGLELLQQTLIDQTRQVTQNVINVLRLQARAAEESLIRLGVVPAVEEEYTLSLDLRLQELTRSGLSWALALSLVGLEDNYEGKPLNPAFGGKGAPNTFRSFFGFAFHVPLGKGRGALSTTAFERAAERSAEAALLQTAHQVSAALLRTLEAYWSLRAAEERLALLGEEVGIAERLAANVEALIGADELPAATRARVEARRASLRQQIAAATLGLVSARAALADALGVPLADFDVEATTPLPAPGQEEAFGLLAAPSPAAVSRFDLRAADEVATGTAILAEAARFDLRRRLDLELAAGYSGLHESFTEEAYDPDALGEALFGDQAGPSVFFGLRLDFPLRNRVALGRLVQSESLAADSEIRQLELARAIEAQRVGLAAQLAEAARVIERGRLAVELRQRQLDDSLARFQGGEATLIDTVLAEEEITFARLDLVDARLRYALLLSRLLHERGDLIGTRRDPEQLVVWPAPLFAAAEGP